MIKLMSQCNLNFVFCWWFLLAFYSSALRAFTNNFCLLIHGLLPLFSLDLYLVLIFVNQRLLRNLESFSHFAEQRCTESLDKIKWRPSRFTCFLSYYRYVSATHFIHPLICVGACFFRSTADNLNWLFNRLGGPLNYRGVYSLFEYFWRGLGDILGCSL